ncbi:XRE family transcriptional regulator [Streptomyces sp. ISL-100]|uniref:XRE family transcriptional regulator n=1 Tax=Streptomyces sp. ISL-100 TaxID=2819173 RepID=UPI001BE84CDE|nr:XRE family transcriptional regulator [Streptomyces sp. ISL-100]MBT2396620.1 XRE family transcriptional regulator [Streptomyces sp. ISL-100]
MPRWKALPEELDPQVKEFASQLRRLVDRSGLSIAAVADRTGYSKTSWERYLNGRLLAPKGAVVALADVTGTNTNHLTTMWELAERAWSRSEMRHDMTMEAIRISQARAALGEFGHPSTTTPSSSPAKGGRQGRRTTTDPSAPATGAGFAGTGMGPGAGSIGAGSGLGAGLGAVGNGAGGSAGAGASGAGGRTPTDAPPQGFGIPPQQGGRGPGPGSGSGLGPGPGSGAGSPDGRRRRRKVTMFLAGVVGALLVIAAAVLLTDLGGKDKDPVAKKKPTAGPTTSAPELPVGVECFGDKCTGEDPEAMGCGGEFAKTTSSATVGTAFVEVRYSKTCGAAWARITQATVGDKVQIASGAETGQGGKPKDQNGLVDADKDAYTPMVAVTKAADAKACATLATGVKGCTTQE